VTRSRSPGTPSAAPTDWTLASRRPVTREMIDALLEHRGTLDSPRLRDALASEDWWPDEIQALVEHLYQAGWVMAVGFAFDWLRWVREAEVLETSPSRIASADAETLRRLITVVSRIDHETEGTLADFISEGTFSRVVDRLAELRSSARSLTEHRALQARLDRAVKMAMDAAAATLKCRPGKVWIHETEQFRPAFVAELTRLLGDDFAVAKERAVVLTTWASGAPGGVDVTVRDSSGILVAAIELKVENVDETLWDVFKLAATCGWTACAYSAVIANDRSWATRDCRELFALSPTQHDSRQLLQRNEKAWRDLLKGSAKARPTMIPATITTEPIVRARLRNEPRYELRVSKISVPLDAGIVAFVGDWPEGMTPSPPASPRSR
jgi:Family of unknown function (DUF6508)